MYYLATVAYESEELDKNNNSKWVKENYVVQGQTIEEVIFLVAKYRGEDTRDSKLVGVKKMPIDCIIDLKNTPHYYKS